MNQVDELEAFVREHRKHFYHYALILTGRPTDAEDLCQDVLVEIVERYWDTRVAGKSADHRVAYVLVMINHRFLNSVRKAGRRPVTDASLEDIPLRDISNFAANPETQLLDHEAFLRRMRELTAEQAATVYHRVAVGASVQETAEFLGISASSVQNRYFRGLQKLKDNISRGVTPR